MTSWIIGVAAFVAMEPLTYLAHRYVMHGPGMRWHASHHGPRSRGLERNDLFPLVFAVPTVAGMYAATRIPWLWWLFPVGAGVTAYGVVYALVHDVYAHRRFVRFRARIPGLEALAAAHRIHHRHGEEPYGFVVPIVPRRLREGRPSPAARSPRPTADTGVEAA